MKGGAEMTEALTGAESTATPEASPTQRVAAQTQPTAVWRASRDQRANPRVAKKAFFKFKPRISSKWYGRPEVVFILKIAVLIWILWAIFSLVSAIIE
jgi:hypothetical protein